MELIYLLIFLISCLIEDIDNVLLKKTDVNAFKDETILHVSEEPSLLQCAQRCKFIDKNAIVDFKNVKCTCVKFEVDEGQEQHGTLSGVFVNQMIMKVKEMEPPQTTQAPKTHVINIAFNKTANQSTTIYDDPSYVANKAIDGDELTRGVTNNEAQQWWSVDLQTTTDILYMILKGYIGNTYNEALIVETIQEESDAWITCKKIGDVKTRPFNFTCDRPTNARFVKVRSTGKCIIHLYEFEVYARVNM